MIVSGGPALEVKQILLIGIKNLTVWADDLNHVHLLSRPFLICHRFTLFSPSINLSCVFQVCGHPSSSLRSS